MPVKKFLKQRAVNIAVGGNYTLANWYDPVLVAEAPRNSRLVAEDLYSHRWPLAMFMDPDRQYPREVYRRRLGHVAYYGNPDHDLPHDQTALLAG